MNKKIKFIAPILCGVMVATSLITTNVQAQTTSQNKAEINNTVNKQAISFVGTVLQLDSNGVIHWSGLTGRNRCDITQKTNSGSKTVLSVYEKAGIRSYSLYNASLVPGRYTFTLTKYDEDAPTKERYHQSINFIYDGSSFKTTTLNATLDANGLVKWDNVPNANEYQTLVYEGGEIVADRSQSIFGGGQIDSYFNLADLKSNMQSGKMYYFLINALDSNCDNIGQQLLKFYYYNGNLYPILN